ncbi:MAG TPA: PH domain-containing protein [Candidatus Udaeobacter sp.]|nr:PH domain-containing protein [Candidatus Udaeobacter sp.]
MNLAKKINLKENEAVAEIIKPAAITYVWKYLFGLVFLFAASFFMFRLFDYGWWGDAIYGLGIFLGLYIILRAWFMRNANLFVITSDRIVDIHRAGWLEEIISAVSYLDIKDIAIRKKGIGQSLFNFGSLTIATKDERLILEIINISHPAKIQLLLAEAGQQYKQNLNLTNSRAIYNNFIKIIPNLTDVDLKETRRLIDEQLGTNMV